MTKFVSSYEGDTLIKKGDQLNVHYFLQLAIDNDQSLGRAERSSLQSKEIICIGKLFHC